MYRQSIFNIVQPIDESKLLIFNSFSEAMIVVREDYYERYIVNCEQCDDTQKLFSLGVIVEEETDEVFRTVCHRRTVTYTGDKKITNIKILVTSGCNARCWYCFEKGIKQQKMSDTTADALISFLKRYADKSGLHIAWFGGEPTLEKQLIYKISDALTEDGFKLTCSVVTNGYAFDQPFMEHMTKYNLNHVQISIDGTGKEYNRVKNYKGNDPDPFARVISNLETACGYEFYKSIRLNFSSENVEQIIKIIDFLHEKFGAQIGVYAAPIIGMGDNLKTIAPALLKLTEKLIECGYITKPSQVYLQSIPVFCGAEIMNFFTVTPDGYLYKCSQEVSYSDHSRSVGNVFDGPKINNVLREWIDEQNPQGCKDCKLLPLCQHGCRGHRLNIQGLDYACIPSKYVINDIIKLMYRYKQSHPQG